MRSSPRRSSSSAARTLWLEVEPATRPITGLLGDDRGQWAFHGWLELAAALQTALARPDDTGSSRAGSTEPE